MLLDFARSHLGALSHARFKSFLQNDEAGLLRHVRAGSRVGICLPQGPACFTCVLATMARSCACPVNQTSPAADIEAELRSFACSAVIVQADEANDSVRRAAAALGIDVIELEPSDSTVGLFRLRGDGGKTSDSCRNSAAAPCLQDKEGVVLALHTSGTSSRKKVVAYTLQTLVIGAACIAASWKLSPDGEAARLESRAHVALLEGGGHAFPFQKAPRVLLSVFGVSVVVGQELPVCWC